MPLQDETPMEQQPYIIGGQQGTVSRWPRAELEFMSNPDIPADLALRVGNRLPFIEKMAGYANMSPIGRARAENKLFLAQLYEKVGMENLAAKAVEEFLHRMQTSRAVNMEYLRLLLVSHIKSSQEISQEISQKPQKRGWFIFKRGV